MLADLIGPMHVRLESVRHTSSFTSGASLCAAYPGIDAVLSVKTIASFRSNPSRQWPALSEVPAVRWTPREVDVAIEYAITSCGSHGGIVSDKLERRYDPMSMRESDSQREADAVVLTAQAMANSVGERWVRLTGK